MSTKATYPEHEKLKAISDDSQTIGEFLDMGLPKLGLTLCTFREKGNNGEPQFIWEEEHVSTAHAHSSSRRKWERGEQPSTEDWWAQYAVENPAFEAWGDHYSPAYKTIETILAEFFGIDRDAIEREKREMLDALRSRPGNAQAERDRASVGLPPDGSAD